MDTLFLFCEEVPDGLITQSEAQSTHDGQCSNEDTLDPLKDREIPLFFRDNLIMTSGRISAYFLAILIDNSVFALEIGDICPVAVL